MKTPKSSDSEEVTPSKKILKQARLPFKTISDVSPKAVTPPSRKRKLSAPDPEPANKINKIDDKSNAEDLVVISDDDSKDTSSYQNAPIKINPIAKLVDTALKKKAQKSKSAKKKKVGVKKSKSGTNEIVENNENACDDKEKGDIIDIVENMDVDEGVVSNDVPEIVDKNIDNNSATHDEFAPVENSNLAIESISEDIRDNNSYKKIQNEELKNVNKDINSPKRSERVKSKNLDASLNSTCDESPCSEPSTPRRSNRNISITNSHSDVSINDSTTTNLTPKQAQKKLESAKKKEDREKERLEREKKKQLEKEEKEKQRREKEDQRKREKEEKEEAKRKEKEEKEEQRRKEKEEKEKQKELEKKMREEKEEQKRKEKEEKEEQKRKEKEAKEEEKRKKHEAIEQEKLEQEQKKKKAAEAFASFFVQKQKGDKDQTTVMDISKNNMLSSFTIKSDMRLAPTIRVTLNDDSRKCLDNVLKEQNIPASSLYLKNIKDGTRKPLTDGKTWPLSDKDDDDVMIVEDELPPLDGIGEIITCESTVQEKLRPKLLAFHDNRRPPYWGTWRKKSTFIKPRKPFKTDVKLLDYEVDSDEEWEEEQDGESIDGSAAGSDDEQDADEYEVDNELFVPHGYLSDEEATMDDDDVTSLSPEAQKARLKHLEDEFETEMKKPTEKLKPWLYGLSWETESGGKPDTCSDSLWSYFEKLSMIMQDPTPFLQPSNDTEESDKKKVKKKKTDNDQNVPKADKKKKSKLDEKEGKKSKLENKKAAPDILKNQPGINSFLTKIKST